MISHEVTRTRNADPVVIGAGRIAEVKHSDPAVIMSDDHPHKKAWQDHVKRVNDATTKQTVHNVIGSLLDYQ